MIKRYFITLLLVVGAGAVIFNYYETYSDSPWTRDGQVSAYIVSITPRVTGQVTEVYVDDNSRVEKGDLLFEIDPAIYSAAYHKAVATQGQAQALLSKARNNLQRTSELEKRMHGAVPTLTLNNLTNEVESAAANLDLAKANVEEAKLNLKYTKVYAPTDGYITNLNLRVGSQVVANALWLRLSMKAAFGLRAISRKQTL
ncbi:membrane fusion protein [Vibrio sp. JCM 19236]|nr:membrane fusion protein [Vibrio sp. JCM 19236]